MNKDTTRVLADAAAVRVATAKARDARDLHALRAPPPETTPLPATAPRPISPRPAPPAQPAPAAPEATAAPAADPEPTETVLPGVVLVRAAGYEIVQYGDDLYVRAPLTGCRGESVLAAMRAQSAATPAGPVFTEDSSVLADAAAAASAPPDPPTPRDVQHVANDGIYVDGEGREYRIRTPLPDVLDDLIADQAESIAVAARGAGAGQVVDAAEDAAEKTGILQRIQNLEQKANDGIDGAVDVLFDAPVIAQAVGGAAELLRGIFVLGNWLKPTDHSVPPVEKRGTTGEQRRARKRAAAGSK